MNYAQISEECKICRQDNDVSCTECFNLGRCNLGRCNLEVKNDE